MDIKECTNILDKLNLINNCFENNDIRKGLVIFEYLRDEIQEEYDKLEALEVGEALTADGYSMLTGREDYVDIVFKARDMGINYIGLSKHELIEMVNNKIMEMRSTI